MERITNYWYYGIVIVFVIAKLLQYACCITVLYILCVTLSFTATLARITQSVEHWALGCEFLGSNLASASYPRSDIGQSLKSTEVRNRQHQ